MSVPTLGPRASLLLGLLSGGSKTEDEVLALVHRIVTEPEIEKVMVGLPPEFGSPLAAARSIHDGGIALVRLLLGRLESAGLAEHVAGHLWIARL